MLLATLGGPEPLALCHSFHISSGEHPPYFMAIPECEACQRWHGRDAKGQKQRVLIYSDMQV